LQWVPCTAILVLVRFDSGLIVHAGDVSGYPPVDEWRSIARFMEAAGFTGLWCAEHHFFWDGWLAPTPTNPMLLGAFIAGQTAALRLGQCGVCLPDHHPLRVAEDIATLDHMSDGRVDFGTMRGLNNRVAGNFNPDADRRDQQRLQALFWESLEVIQSAWSDEPLRHEGEFYTFPFPGWRDESAPAEELDQRFYSDEGELIALEVLPKPLQQPIPTYVMADTISSVARAAARGLGVLTWAQGLEATRAAVGAYREAMPEAGTERFGIMRPVFVAPTMEAAEAVMRPSINLEMGHITGGAVSATWRGRQAFLGPDEELTDADRTDDWFDFLNRRGWCFVGTPAHVTEQLERVERELDVHHIALYWALPLLSYEQAMGSMRLFADHVMPHFSAGPAVPVAGV
jgi:alkanesulfonate monooxygenase SsuD/methylene tetrahydromethanopterin reductase-like flavin-dependent oxidoreductase (luciferase family)